MEKIVGILSVFCIACGVYSVIRISKVKGIAEFAMASVSPAIAIIFGSLQKNRVFGGTKWQFFVHSATVDGDIWPWILFALLGAEILCICATAVFVTVKFIEKEKLRETA